MLFTNGEFANVSINVDVGVAVVGADAGACFWEAVNAISGDMQTSSSHGGGGISIPMLIYVVVR